MLGNIDANDQLTLHTFCDASQSAYAVVIFIRIERHTGVEVQFVQAKSRVAPVKNITIPRLELLAATIATRLAKSVLEILQLADIRTYYWSDSSTVLAWIQRECHWGTFVWNRVQEIQTLLTTLKEKNIEPNYRKDKVVDSLGVYHFSDYRTILRVVAWIKRFIRNSRSKKELHVRDKLSVVELKESEITLLRVVQYESFIDENNDRIRHLNTFKDDQGIIRLSTKIIMKEDAKNFRYPLVLPADCCIVRLIIREKHEQLLHAGVQILMNNIREQFWILGGRRTVRSVIRQCVVCRRHDAKAIQAIPAPLPEDRVRDAAVFEIVGIDLAGPVFLKGSQKAWIVLFTCAVYRAVQLELVTSLSTVSFLEAFRRFVARPGRPTVVYSDNGKNFVGLNNLFSKVNWDEVAKTGTVQKIEWKFNPPTAAWWGGCPAYEEMLTVLCDCEAVINSRPITFMSDSAQDLVPLSPSMFLQEIREIGVPDCDQIERLKLDKKFAYRQKIKDDLQRRFRVEYLGELIHHNNKRKELRKIQVGDIVLIEDESKKRVEWPLARVKDIIIGKGNEVRVVRLITTSGELIRPIQRIYPLELTSDQSKEVVQELINEKSNTDYNPNNKISEVPRHNPVETPVVTRSGRIIKKPKRFL
ncbi:PREDICTED: uncharacterized protein LOC105460953 [Wasmannia auropunctata]|uniref:uncharacterized protein LOC105460953 n=1 Tax=Wasmannia auropunctata TaxID=64793 RepID=UPI0005EDEF4C|nr:PREDICTED: uncharacterized protein LOC105460953 [Wasmannia auropunctata]